jgi:pyruvate/2-oxoglutarate dehydrogenase complex dihydrolipoamide dehydrogenase (E3) component
MSNVIVVIGAGSIGQAIARRVSAGKQVLLAPHALYRGRRTLVVCVPKSPTCAADESTSGDRRSHQGEKRLVFAAGENQACRCQVFGTVE